MNRGKRFNVKRKLTSTLRLKFGGRIRSGYAPRGFYLGCSRSAAHPFSASGHTKNLAFWFTIERPAAYGMDKFE